LLAGKSRRETSLVASILPLHSEIANETLLVANKVVSSLSNKAIGFWQAEMRWESCSMSAKLRNNNYNLKQNIFIV